MDKVLRRDPKAVTLRDQERDLHAADAPATPALVLDHLSQSYGTVRAVDDISLAMAPGEIIALLGHSGSGKSTLLRLIAGLDHARSGWIVIDGRNVSDPFVPPEDRGVGMMFQDYALFPHLTVLGNLKFGLNRIPAAEATQRACAALDRIGLGARGSDYPHRLSGGEQQRVALARALLPNPSILLMDEPFSNLDRHTRDLIRGETDAILRDSATTAILVTHDPEDAMRLADRIMLMHAGRVVQSGTAEELYRRPASLIAARFFSDFNEIEGVCRDGVVATALGRFPAGGLADGAAATVCIRPRDVSLDLPVGAGGLSGTVVSRAFLGDDQLVTVALAGVESHFAVRLPIEAKPEVGQAVALAVAADKVLVFAAVEAGNGSGGGI
jgi:iron(III) transport system ATP-binding protein